MPEPVGRLEVALGAGLVGVELPRVEVDDDGAGRGAGPAGEGAEHGGGVEAEVAAAADGDGEGAELGEGHGQLDAVSLAAMTPNFVDTGGELAAELAEGPVAIVQSERVVARVVGVALLEHDLQAGVVDREARRSVAPDADAAELLELGLGRSDVGAKCLGGLFDRQDV